MKTFHIDLSHIADTSGMYVKFRSHKLELQAHDTNTITLARQAHPALSALPLETCLKRFTHFVPVSEDLFSQHHISWVKVLRPQKDPKIRIPDLILMSIHIPESVQRHQLRKWIKDKKPYFHPMLTYYGVNHSPDLAEDLETHVTASYLLNSLSTASATLQLHHELCSTQPYTSNIIATQHVLPDVNQYPDRADQYNNMVALSNAIADPNNQPWAPTVQCTDLDGNPMTSQYDLLDSNGQGFKTGDPVYRQDLNENVQNLCSAPICGAKQTAFDDTNLQNQTWSVQHGKTATYTQQNQQTPSNTSPTSLQDTSENWNLNELGMHYGLYLDPNSVVFDSTNDTLSIKGLNWFMRTLTSYYQLLDDSGNPVVAGDASKVNIGSIPGAASVMGIPVPNIDQPAMVIPLNGSSQFNLIFGSLGTSDWDSVVSPSGAFTTGIFQILIPTIFFAAGVYLPNSSFFSELDDPASWKLLFMTILRFIGSISGGAKRTDSAVKWIAFFANQGLALLLQKGLMTIGAKVAAQVAAGEIEESSAGPIGIGLRLAAIVAGGAALAETTGEVLASPASIIVKLSRTCTVTVTLHPDPTHGEAGHPETAIWPAVAQTYQVMLEYKSGGTSNVQSGTMLSTPNGDPISVTVPNVLAGSQSLIRLTAGFYSNTGWLCGTWQSDWIPAVPTQGNILPLADQYITEILVPLTQDSQYQFQAKIVNENGSYVWQASDTPPSTTITNLDCSTTGQLCKLVGLTLSNSAFQVGYIWYGAGHNLPVDGVNNPPSSGLEYIVKNLSVLSHPSSGLKDSQIGFSAQPAIAYSPINTKDTQNIDQRNFILDPRNGQMHLRQVTLGDNSQNFGLTATNLESWGCFPIASLDAIAVHPSNKVLGISYKCHKLMILSLPDAPSPDDQAVQALMLSGKGLRQGLMQGPKAMKITADGRILILESISQRVQAFDIKGNPVPCFVKPQSQFVVTTSDEGTAFAAAMDGGTIPDSLQSALQDNYLTFLAPLSVPDTAPPGYSLTQSLDSGKFQPPPPNESVSQDPLLLAFSNIGIFLSYDGTQMNDPTVSSSITVNQAGQSWTITDPKQNQVYLVLNQGMPLVFQVVNLYQIQAIAPCQHWTFYHQQAAQTYEIQADATQTGNFNCHQKQSFFPINRRPNSTYLDLAVENKGFIYILSYINDGSQTSDYYLDIYAPDGSYLSTIPDSTKTLNPQNIVAGKIVVDSFRNLFTLNYETIAKATGGSEPSLSEWIPTTPLFGIPSNAQVLQDFNSQNISAVIQYFADNGKITLDYQGTFITSLPNGGSWLVKDSTNSKNYSVIWSGDSLLVYGIPI